MNSFSKRFVVVVIVVDLGYTKRVKRQKPSENERIFNHIVAVAVAAAHK